MKIAVLVLAGVVLGFGLGVISAISATPFNPVSVVNGTGSSITLAPGAEVTIIVRKGAVSQGRVSRRSDQEL